MIMLLTAIIATTPFVILCFFAVRLSVSLSRFHIKKTYTSALTAPSVSVCIPARNETHAMTQCLERVLASDYAKLEVLVYDDSSIDNTSYLIRSFAHAGVRFVPGEPLPDGWLGKNHALEVLAREASGTFVVFMDVDTFIEPTSISQLVGYTLTEDVDMAAVIPGRNDTWRSSVLFGHLRYFWELVVWNKKQPACSSSLWLIRRHTLLETYGGFESLKSDVVPESVLAGLIGTNRYHCLLNNIHLGVTYEKKWRSQMETSRRLLYPRTGGSLLSGLFYLAILTLINSPIFIIAAGLLFGWSFIQFEAMITLIGFMLLYGVYIRRTWRSGWWVGMLLWPIVALQELTLLVLSIIGYMTNTVTWKGRLVTQPAIVSKATR
jgi:glycosyltransferase involved in cell wall biosynthesis